MVCRWVYRRVYSGVYRRVYLVAVHGSLWHFLWSSQQWSFPIDCAWFTAEFTASQIGLTAEFTFCGHDRAGFNAEFTAWFAAEFTAEFTAVLTAEFTLLPSMGHCGISFGRRSSDLSRSYLEQAVRVFIGAALHAPPGHPWFFLVALMGFEVGFTLTAFASLMSPA
jgi:hypothetical protein